MTTTKTGTARRLAKLATIVMAASAMMATLLTPGVANAEVVNPAPSAQVSFTFDDGFLSSLDQAAKTLKKHDLTGTSYVIADCVGMTKVPNSCRAKTDAKYMTWKQIQELQSKYGWEIGSHGFDHQCLASEGDDCQATKLTEAEMEAQLVDSKSALAAQGVNATAFAPPYGDYDQSVMAKAAKHYSSMRGFADVGVNRWPYSDYLINNVPVQQGIDTVATLKAKVDEAIADDTWVVFTFHDIVKKPSSDPDDYEFGVKELDQLAKYVKQKVKAGQLRAVNVSQGLVAGSPNKLPNASFNSGIGEGWSTDNPEAITSDSEGNGSHPDPTRSIKLVSDGTSSHLFSPATPVTPGTNYLYKTFLNVMEVASGEVAFYVDEYDAAGSWISGQYRAREGSRWVEELNFTYTPSSTSVASARLQVIVEGTGIVAYLDNVEFLALGEETSPTPPANLVANGTFDAGLSEGWSTDAADSIVADGAGNGAPANPLNSVELKGTSETAHLFSPPVDVTPGNYMISAYLNFQNRTAGEVGWYIDEYDASGNWISGQWKLANTELGVFNVDLSYSPSTADVAQASLQVYVTEDSGLLAYVDDVSWWRP